tara:strand:+ start:12761 stop:13588 length:828 start_codon:yes stop_codon:yes gene_type:complete
MAEQQTVQDILDAGGTVSPLQSEVTSNQTRLDEIETLTKIPIENEKDYLNITRNSKYGQALYNERKSLLAANTRLNKKIGETGVTRDSDILAERHAEALASGIDKDVLEASQDALRLLDLEQAFGSQLESEQLAQRAVFRDQQANAQAQQQAQAQITNMTSQSFGTNSALQGTISSIGSQGGVVASDLSVDSERLSASLIDNIDFLNQTFDLGGDIAGANQSLLQQRADEQASAQKRAGLIGGVTAGASIGATVGGSTGAVVGGAIGLLTAVFDF